MDFKLGVFLDLGSVDNGDLDLGRLSRTLPDWQLHDFTTAKECPGRIVNANVVISNKCVLDRSALSSAPALDLIVIAATGTNNVDLDCV